PNGFGNSVAAQSLRGVAISADVPSSGMVLTASGGTNASWQVLPSSGSSLSAYSWSGSGAPSILPSVLVWNGRVTTSGATVPFYVTSDGTGSGSALFSNLSSAFITVSCSTPS